MRDELSKFGAGLKRALSPNEDLFTTLVAIAIVAGTVWMVCK
jgi:hypothetical protein